MAPKLLAVDRILRLYTAPDGEVWCGCCRIGAMKTGIGPAEFVNGQLLRDAEEVRLLGVPENAPLITKMFERRTKSPKLLTARIYIGSPGVCFRRDKFDDPRFVLRQMWQPPCQARVCGCWHELTERDYTSYYMLCALRESGGRVSDVVRNIASYHPAWPAITFPATANTDVACELLCAILDPRWYNHVDHPGRATRLFNFAGLIPANFEQQPLSTCGRHLVLSGMVLRAWSGSGDDGSDLNEPRNFLWRIYRHHGGGGRGLLRASKCYLQLVRLVWLQELASGNQEVFAPKIFFKHACEAEAFEAHAAVVKKRL